MKGKGNVRARTPADSAVRAHLGFIPQTNLLGSGRLGRRAQLARHFCELGCHRLQGDLVPRRVAPDRVTPHAIVKGHEGATRGDKVFKRLLLVWLHPAWA